MTPQFKAINSQPSQQLPFKTTEWRLQGKRKDEKTKMQDVPLPPPSIFTQEAGCLQSVVPLLNRYGEESAVSICPEHILPEWEILMLHWHEEKHHASYCAHSHEKQKCGSMFLTLMG